MVMILTLALTMNIIIDLMYGAADARGSDTNRMIMTLMMVMMTAMTTTMPMMVMISHVDNQDNTALLLE